MIQNIFKGTYKYSVFYSSVILNNILSQKCNTIEIEPKRLH